MTQSIPQQIRTRVLNTTIGQWMRSVDLVLSEYTPRDQSVEDEADHVTKIALLMMLTRWYDEDDICLLLDSTSLRLPAKLAKTGKYELKRILDSPPSGEYQIEDFGVTDEDAPPGPDGPSFSLRSDEPASPLSEEPQAP